MQKLNLSFYVADPDLLVHAGQSLPDPVRTLGEEREVDRVPGGWHNNSQGEDSPG